MAPPEVRGHWTHVFIYRGYRISNTWQSEHFNAIWNYITNLSKV